MEDQVASAPLERSISQLSSASTRSQRSGTVRARTRRLASHVSHVSSSASSIAPSDKSLTSFPSFSTESSDAIANKKQSSIQMQTSHPHSNSNPTSAFIDVSGTTPTNATPDPDHSTADRSSIIQQAARSALFDDDNPLPTSRKIPGALHHADDGHIERLVSRIGAVPLVRQIAEDLANRDAQMAAYRRRADNRERALRKIIFECGLSSLDLETRLRAIESDPKANAHSSPENDSGNGISDLMSDAMSETVLLNADATIRAPAPHNPAASKGTLKGWKDYIWGSGAGSNIKDSAPSSLYDDNNSSKAPSVMRGQGLADRRPGLAEDLFHPPGAPGGPDVDSIRSSSRASSTYSAPQGRKTSLASFALRLVAGTSSLARDTDSARGRTISVGHPASLRESSATSVQTTGSTRAMSGAGPKALMNIRRSTGTAAPSVASAVRSQTALERWEAGNSSSKAITGKQDDNYGPVEMDTILPPDTQPPTLTTIYRNRDGSEFLTDRFGFIYDQRRKKRQREASKLSHHIKSNSRTETLANGRTTQFAPSSHGSDITAHWDVEAGSAPTSPGPTSEDKSRRWQDYLKIATFPTELLSHTPSVSADALEVLEPATDTTTSKLPSMPISQSRGFLPQASTTTTASASTTSVTPEADVSSTPEPEGSEPSTSPTGVMLVKEDAEPVRLLLHQLCELHDILQKEKTVRWNDFLRKVRAERRREGEAAAAAAAGSSGGGVGGRHSSVAAGMPETKLTDGEIIGIAGLGNKGKVGRAKWNEFKGLVLGGIPVAYRAKIWSECCGAMGLRIPGYYDDLVGGGERDMDPAVVAQIKMDINRTLTDNIFFRQGPGVGKLEEMLLAYARRNTDVGYCQGMNLIAANLLLIMPSAEDAFWILAAFIEHILPTGYYDHSLLTSRADQQVLRRYVADVLPRLSQHLDSLGVELEALTFQWFLSVFTDCLSAEALFRVWDVVLCASNGSTFLFQVAVALLKLNESQLLGLRSTAGVYTYIGHQMTNHAISIDGLLQASEGLRRVVRREEVEKRRDGAVEEERGRGGVMAVEEDRVEGQKKGDDTGREREGGLEVREPMPIEEEGA